MVFKLRTSKNTMLIFEELSNSLHLQPFALCKLSIALSLYSESPLCSEDFNKDNDGLELNRQTITGEYDDLFKALIISHTGVNLSDDEYFPKYLKAHIDRGSQLLITEFKYSNGNFYKHLIALDKGI